MNFRVKLGLNHVVEFLKYFPNFILLSHKVNPSNSGMIIYKQIKPSSSSNIFNFWWSLYMTMDQREWAGLFIRLNLVSFPNMFCKLTYIWWKIFKTFIEFWRNKSLQVTQSLDALIYSATTWLHYYYEKWNRKNQRISILECDYLTGYRVLSVL